jgi:hypothetical protein
VAVFLELNGERAAAFRVQRQTDESTDVEQSRSSQAIPLHRRISSDIVVHDELAILNKENGPHDNWRNVSEGFKPGSVPGDISQESAIARPHTQPCYRRLIVWRIDSPVEQTSQCRGISGLSSDRESRGFEPVDKPRDFRIAAIAIERSPFGKVIESLGPDSTSKEIAEA